MKLHSNQLQSLCDLAVRAATAAAEQINTARGEALAVSHKVAGESLASQVVTAIDLQSQMRILEILTPTLERYDLGLLTEESADNGSRFAHDYFWCIDPLDGTLPFIEGNSGFAVSIALIDRGGTPQLGVVAIPSTGQLYRAIRGAHAGLDKVQSIGEKSDIQNDVNCLEIYADRSFQSHRDFSLIQATLEQGIGAVDWRFGAGAVVNALSVIGKRAACYFKLPKSGAGGGSIWDFAATECIFESLGLSATNWLGEPINCNEAEDSFMNRQGVLFASSPVLAEKVRRLVDAALMD